MHLILLRLCPLFFLLLAYSSRVHAQLGGSDQYAWLHLPASTQQLALGSYHMSKSCQDVSMQFANPALLADSIAGWAALSYNNYFAGINGGTAAYAKELKHGVLGLGVRYMNYGSFDSYDPTGLSTGNFRAADYAIQASYGLQHKVYRLGLALKWVQSGIEQYRSNALLFDIGGGFKHPTKDFQIAWLVKNIGFRISDYAGQEVFNMPMDVQLSMSVKPQHMPLRLHITAHHLHDFGITYIDPSLAGKTDALGNPLQEAVSFADKLASHFAIGGEFVLGKRLRVLLGYNILKRREMALPEVAGTVGFSWGLVFQTERWQASYAREASFIGQSISAFTFSIAPAQWVKKKRVIQ